MGFWVRLHPTSFFHGDIRDSRKYDAFRSRKTSRSIYKLMEMEAPFDGLLFTAIAKKK